MIESAVGIIGACLPLLRPLFFGRPSPGFMRNMRSVNVPVPNTSGTFWDHSDNSKLRNQWNNSLASTKFSQASTKMEDNVNTTNLGSISPSGNHEDSIRAIKWEKNSLPPVDPKYH